jgi:hypothetical protein
MTPSEIAAMLIVLPILAACVVGAFSEFPRDPNGGTSWEGKWFTDRVHALLYEHSAPLRDRRRFAIYTLLMFLIGISWLLGAAGLFLALVFVWTRHDATRIVFVALLFVASIVWIRIGHRIMGDDQRRW